MNQTGNGYRLDIDLLKGFAILAVVLYHMGITQSGYLGVDVFFAINGFLIVPKVINDVNKNSFRYFSFLEKRIMRLLPLVLIVSGLSLVAGYWGMLPDDYENLSESVVATNCLSNNILESVTTRNYWDVRNEYKALMHTWYIGILFEFYLLFPLVVMLVKKLSNKLHFSFSKYVVLVIISLSILSVFLYLDPSVTTGDRFYLLQYRFFEIASGGLAGIWIVNYHNRKLYTNGILSVIILIMLLLVMFLGMFSVSCNKADVDIAVSGKESEFYIPQNILLLITILLTIFLLLSDNLRSRVITWLVNLKFFCQLGVMSYSIYLWHQPILAFYRYFVSNQLTIPFCLIFLIVVFALSFMSYQFIEKKLKVGMNLRLITIPTFLLITGTAFALYLHAGVVRDVPELNIFMNNVHRNMHAEYVDRIYSYDKEFPKGNNKPNVLVIGNSFARDWANILLESKVADKINISYIYKIDEKYAKRIRQADYVFIHDWKHNVPYYVWENIKPRTEVWGIGTKNFGESNGIIYKNRHRPDYFEQTAKVNPNYFIENSQMKREWKDKYIDLLDMALVKNNEVIVFSKEHKFLSQDCRHLSKGGAEYYANKIDFHKIFPSLSL